jgi:hypothetical protein
MEGRHSCLPFIGDCGQECPRSCGSENSDKRAVLRTRPRSHFPSQERGRIAAGDRPLTARSSPGRRRLSKKNVTLHEETVLSPHAFVVWSRPNFSRFRS